MTKTSNPPKPTNEAPVSRLYLNGSLAVSGGIERKTFAIDDDAKLKSITVNTVTGHVVIVDKLDKRHFVPVSNVKSATLA